MKEIKRFQIGKNGLTQNFIEQIKTYFEKSKAELIKISILKSICKDKKDAKKISNELIEGLGNMFTGKLIGHTIVVRRWRKPRQ